jgi:pimeloyl-ACP methyl ester carboxylesterase
MGEVINSHVNFKKIYSAEEFGITSEKLSLTTSDGLKLAAYEVDSSAPKAVVIFLSGIQNPSVTAFYGHAAMLRDNGYASILCEMRAHGESEGNIISFGYKEHLDVKAVVDYIKEQEKYQNTPIVVYGLSMGGAVAINAIGEIPEIDGLISMSALSSFEDVFYDSMINMGMPKFFCVLEKPFVKLYAVYKYGFSSIGFNPKNQIRKLGNRPALIYHSRSDSQVPYRSFERIMENTSGSVETWVKDGDFHFPNENFENPLDDAEYSDQIMGFLNRHFGTEVSDNKIISDFSISVNNKYIALKDWDNQVDLKGILGAPVSEKKQVLGNGADTHTGSFIKTLFYDGLEIRMFSPKENGNNFWIMSIKVTSKTYAVTTKSIIIGDSVNKMKELYPEIEMAKDGRTDPDNCEYMLSSNDDSNYLVFEVKDGIISEINIYHEIP